jgi:hypothetical protein
MEGPRGLRPGPASPLATRRQPGADALILAHRTLAKQQRDKAMFVPDAQRLRRRALTTGLTTMLTAVGIAGAAAAGRGDCAAREAIVVTRMDSHRMASANITLWQARKACDSGRVGEAVMLYDRLIGELSSFGR